MPKITDYEPIVGSHTIEELRILAGKLQGKVIQNINSTAVGGGVAEILNRMVPLLQELGVDARWDFIKGGESFFNATKKFHNALHGKSEEITPQMFEIFMETSQRNIDEVKIYGDVMFIHDPQPIVLIKKGFDAGQQMDLAMPYRRLNSQQTGMGLFGAFYSSI